jgi:hypothetical protein
MPIRWTIRRRLALRLGLLRIWWETRMERAARLRVYRARRRA